MNSSNKAPLVSLSTVAPSLESSPAKTASNEFAEIAIDDEDERRDKVQFQTGSLTPSSCSSSSSESIAVKSKIPDGGWGWMVVLASLILSMIADGISFSFGLLYVEFLNEFGASKSTTSWIGSLFMAVPLLSGPIMSALVDKYGCRPMTIIGGLISASGFIISSRVNSIGIMYLTFGLLAGLGLGLCYVTAVVSIAFWFDKKRTLAVSLGAAGTGIGTFVFSPLTTFLLQEYGWRWTTLLLSGAFLNMCVCGALMRDPDWITEQNLNKSEKSSKTSLLSLSSNFQNSIDINELKELLKSGKDAEYLLHSLETTLKESPKTNTFHSVLSLPTFVKQHEKVPVEVLEQLSGNKRLYNVILRNYPSLLLSRSNSDKAVNKEGQETPDRQAVTLCMTLKKSEKPPVKKQPSLSEDPTHLSSKKIETVSPKRNSSFPWMKPQNQYLKNLKVHRQSLVHRGAILNFKKYKLRASSCPNIYRISMASIPKEEDKWYQEWVDLIKEMFNFSLFLELHFFLMSLSTIILFIWFIVPYFYLAEHMLRYDYTDEQVSFTISNIGVTNTIGMIFLGWAGDQPWMNLTKTYAICLFFCGISCAGIMFFSSNYIMLEICAGLFGVFLSSNFSFTPGILMELVPLESFTLAYGLQLLCMGIGNLLGPPLAGHLFDVTGNWEQSFYQAAIWIFVAGIIVLGIPLTKNRKIIGSGPVEKDLAAMNN